MENYDTLSEAIDTLRTKGYTTDFNLRNDALQCSSSKTLVYPNEFVVDSIFRFEGMTDPADEAILYAISSSNGLNGVLLNGYGIYNDPLTDELVAKLKP